jgi:nitrite reductase/ring-hydroxylating ferredoxin subunit
MNNLFVENIFAAGGVSNETIEIVNVKPTNRDDVLTGTAKLPATSTEQKVVIYQAVTESGEYDYRAISASCPHQGVDISRDELKPDGNVYCSLHKRPICVFSKFNQAFSVEERSGQYFIIQS